MGETIRVYEPSATCFNEPQQLRRTLDNLGGKIIGFIDNAKPNFNYLVDDLAELLIRKYGVASVIKRSKFTPSVPAPEKVMKELSEQCDAVIAGSGD